MSCHERWTFQLSSIGTQLWEVWTTWLDDFSLNVYCKPSHFHVRGTFLLTKKNYDVIAEHEEVSYNLELYLSRHCTAFDIFVFRTWGGFHLRLEGSMFNVCDTIARVGILCHAANAPSNVWDMSGAGTTMAWNGSGLMLSRRSRCWLGNYAVFAILFVLWWPFFWRWEGQTGQSRCWFKDLYYQEFNTGVYRAAEVVREQLIDTAVDEAAATKKIERMEQMSYSSCVVHVVTCFLIVLFARTWCFWYEISSSSGLVTAQCMACTPGCSGATDFVAAADAQCC